jgi:hypothetical protein
MHAPSEERKTNKPNQKLYRNVYNHEQIRNEIVQSMGEEVDVCPCLIFIYIHSHLQSYLPLYIYNVGGGGGSIRPPELTPVGSCKYTFS